MEKRIIVLMVICAIGIAGCSNTEQKTQDQDQQSKSTLDIFDWKLFPEKELGVKETAELAEIDAVANLKSDTAKVEGLTAIISRPDLSPEAQIHVIPAVMDVFSASDKENLLKALVNNPSFTYSAKSRLLSKLDKIGSEEVKIQVLKEVNKRDQLINK